ncbi:GNAT family N-acetyltransferase [Fischerella sp. PCC 9605]|uniref:GNAT family N-acetyltransferase n=1 Tax=Fischerella sp. PCC 9605 TaxID=1173024 RepID=UPI00047EA442|nr:GNAT family N-acetyltransferase [Fischerella sp. PCC 9605]
MQGKVLQDLSAPNLVTALENNLFAFMTNYGNAPNSELYCGSNLTRFTTGVCFPFFNGVLRAQLNPDDIDTTITETLNYYTALQLPMFWWTGPETQPPDLRIHLENHGLNCVSELPVMAIDLSTLPQQLPLPADLDIALVNDSETLKHWVRVAMVGFEVPDTEFDRVLELELSLGINSEQYKRFIGWWKGVPVATSELYLDAGVAGIYFVATLPEVRRQGLATAVVLAALQKARTLGYCVGMLQASQMGVNVYRRIGFQEYCKMGLYLWAGEQSYA